MRTQRLLIAGIASVALAGASGFAQAPAAGTVAPTGPDPREIPVPRIATRLGALPGVNALPARTAMPDVLVTNDGTRITTARQWPARRQEMRRILAYYAVGQMPAPPGNVKGREIRSELVLDGTVRYRLVRLTFGPESRLSLDVGVFTPAQGGPFPAVILQGGTPPGGTVLPRLPQGPNQGRGENVLVLVGPVPPAPGSAATGAAPAGGGLGPAAPATAASIATERAEVFRRGYALVLFNPNDCAEDTTLRNLDGSWAFRTTRYFPAYPGYDWGILAGWAWGASRVADHLEDDPSIDARTLVITGASRYGKAAMVAAAFDDRLMSAPVVTCLHARRLDGDARFLRQAPARQANRSRVRSVPHRAGAGRSPSTRGRTLTLGRHDLPDRVDDRSRRLHRHAMPAVRDQHVASTA